MIWGDVLWKKKPLCPSHATMVHPAEYDSSAALPVTCMRDLKVLSCRALASQSSTLPPAWAAPAEPALARAVCVLDCPLQEGESQARLVPPTSHSRQ